MKGAFIAMSLERSDPVVRVVVMSGIEFTYEGFGVWTWRKF